MRVSHILPVRDKAFAVEETAKRILAQTCERIEIILSDQGSEDGSLDILKRVEREYRGPHLVRVLECPDTEYRGMAGLNRHFNWIHGQTDADIIIQSSADDLDEVTRDEKVIAAFKKFNPSFVGTGMMISHPHQPAHAVTYMPDKYDRWVNIAESIQSHCFSAVGPSWKRELFVKMGGLRGIESSDFIIPLMALFDDGFYYLQQPLYTQVAWASQDNTGVEGQMRVAEQSGDMTEQLRIRELNQYHHIGNWAYVWRRWTENGYLSRLSPEAQQALTDKIFSLSDAWAQARHALTLQRIEPKAFRV